MNRRYNAAEYQACCEILREEFDNPAITTDVIVGFPGETEEEFAETERFLKAIHFYEMHIFKYSQRKGTKAAVMPNQIDGNIKDVRSKRLLKLSDENEEEYNQKYIGQEIEVLFEEQKDGEYRGHTKNYILVYCKTDKNLENKLQKVICKKCEKDHIIAEI